MAARGRPRRRRILTVVFDTNALFHREFDAMVCQNARDLIARHSNHGDLGVRWVIPEIVRGEREFQMRNEFRGISSHVAKAESLFDGQWGVTQETIEQRIAARIAAELAALHIDVVPCANERVDWNDMMRRACFREPPFERGQTEKGFRDAVICETFIQLATDLVGGDTAMLVSNDRLVRQCIESRGIARNRARIVDDLNALDDEIQLRVANVDEDTQALIERRAQLLFLPWENRSDPTSLWSREGLYERIWREFGERLKAAPSGMTHVTLGYELSNARLVSKEGTRVHFASIFFVRSAFRIWVPSPNVRQDPPASTVAPNIGSALQGLPVLQGLPAFQALPTLDQPMANSGLLGALGVPPSGEWQQIEKPVKDAVLIRWSATFTRNRTLARASIDSLEMAE
ncbi:PIN domain-containing protein [Burkholderia ubonensis]|uniref:PIN domain-containing protein n=1 Tax=Burkholderia ubonensis TaxID=101571 RepID=UPI000AE2E72C|nr:PIN domain-containing protein [Burkholderia ubonensis]